MRLITPGPPIDTSLNLEEPPQVATMVSVESGPRSAARRAEPPSLLSKVAMPPWNLVAWVPLLASTHDVEIGPLSAETIRFG